MIGICTRKGANIADFCTPSIFLPEFWPQLTLAISDDDTANPSPYFLALN
jgi:hypothetical protein